MKESWRDLSLKKLSAIALFSFVFIYSQPNPKDYIRLAAELSCFSYTQFVYHHPTIKTNIETPNNFDAYIRKKIHWKKPMNDYAGNISDLLLYGIFVGGIPFSSFYLKSQNSAHELLLINLEILSINGLITNFVKYTTNRQRPYSFYTSKEDNDETYKSFFSGHTSTAFAIGTSTAKMFSKYSNINNRTIWISSLGLATATGYLRIAADKHYFTDVLTGAIVGSLIGSTVFDILIQKYKNNKLLKNQIPKISYTPYNIKLTVPL